MTEVSLTDCMCTCQNAAVMVADKTECISGSWCEAKKVIEIVLLVIVVLLVIIGLIIGFYKLKRGEDEEDDDEGNTYY